MHIIINGKKEETTLQKGDQCTWLVEDETITFHRDGERLLRSNSDDKFAVGPIDRGQFTTLIDVLAEAVGLKPRLVANDGTVVTFSFE